MRGGFVELTKGPVRRTMLAFAVPILISQAFQQLYSMVDSAIVGNFLGREALAAVSSSSSLNQLLTSLMIGIANGAGVVISRYFGAEDHKTVSDAIHTTCAFGLIGGLIMSVIGIFASPVLLRWMGTAEDVLDASVIYFRNYFMGAIAVMMYNALTGIMNALGDSRRPLYYLIVSSILNVILDLLFIGVMGMGVGSAAVATVISQAVSASLCWTHLRRIDSLYRLVPGKIRVHGPLMRQVLRMGLPTGVQNSMIAVGNVTLQSFINAYGSIAMAGCGIYSKLQGFVFLPILSFSMALTTFLSQNLGAGAYDRAREGARFGIQLCVICAEITGIVLILLNGPLCSLFSKDAEVIEIARRQGLVENGFFFLLAFSHAIAGLCRGCGRASVPMMIMLSVWCVFRIIFISVLTPIVKDISLLFWAYPVTWFISSILFLIFYNRADWIHSFERKA